jgi:hypothetical protein
MHPRLEESHFSPHFHGAIGAIDGTHIPIIVPSSATITHFGQYHHTTQNVMDVCDFDMRFTFIVAGWPGSVHDIRVFNEALQKYYNCAICYLDTYIVANICHKYVGKYYLVHSSYANKKGFLSPYKGEKYHLLEFQQGPTHSGKKEMFNHLHSSLHNVIE